MLPSGLPRLYNTSSHGECFNATSGRSMNPKGSVFTLVLHTMLPEVHSSRLAISLHFGQSVVQIAANKDTKASSSLCHRVRETHEQLLIEASKPLQVHAKQGREPAKSQQIVPLRRLHH